MRGEPFLYPGAVRALIREHLERARRGESARTNPLTPREQEIVKLIAEAHTNDEIASPARDQQEDRRAPSREHPREAGHDRPRGVDALCDPPRTFAALTRTPVAADWTDGVRTPSPATPGRESLVAWRMEHHPHEQSLCFRSPSSVASWHGSAPGCIDRGSTLHWLRASIPGAMQAPDTRDAAQRAPNPTRAGRGAREDRDDCGEPTARAGNALHSTSSSRGPPTARMSPHACRSHPSPGAGALAVLAQLRLLVGDPSSPIYRGGAPADDLATAVDNCVAGLDPSTGRLAL